MAAIYLNTLFSLRAGLSYLSQSINYLAALHRSHKLFLIPGSFTHLCYLSGFERYLSLQGLLLKSTRLWSKKKRNKEGRYREKEGRYREKEGRKGRREGGKEVREEKRT